MSVLLIILYTWTMLLHQKNAVTTSKYDIKNVLIDVKSIDLKINVLANIYKDLC